METLSALRDFATGLPYFTHAFFACLCALILLREIAPALGLMDKPDSRKRHDVATPVVGGPAIFAAVAVSIVVFVPHSITAVFMTVAFAVLVLGMVDDRYTLSARFRIFAQLAIAWLTVALGGVEIHRIGNLIGFGVFEFDGLFALGFSMVCIIGVINSYNMIDGLDGLSGGLAFLSFVGIGVICMLGGYDVGAQLAMIFCGALLAFLCLNARILVPRARVFLGDSGSTLIGFSLAWFFISLTQSDGRAISPVVAGWLFGLPLIDTVSVMIRRVSAGMSPMTAGRDHLHHRLIATGLSVNKTVALMCALQAVMVGIGVLANPYAALEPFLFIGFVGLVISYHVFLVRSIDWLNARAGNSLETDVPTPSTLDSSLVASDDKPTMRPEVTSDTASGRTHEKSTESAGSA